MKLNIIFSIFDSPTSAFANVSGDIELPSLPRVGDEVMLFSNDESHLFLGFAGRDRFAGSLHVESIVPLEGSHDEVTVILEDVVMDSKEAALELTSKLESKWGLFCLEY